MVSARPLLLGALLAAALAPAVPVRTAAAEDRGPLTAPRPAPRLLPDPALAAAVRAELRVPEGEKLTAERLRDLYFLRAKDAGIASLEGLRACPNLALIDLAGNSVSDLAPLELLASLQSLDLADNSITDLAPLAGLKSLQYVKLDGNGVADLAPLAGLDRLSALYLPGNGVSDLGPLTGLKKLTSLDLARNRITDAGPLKDLPWLSSLTLTGNEITDVTPLASLREPRYLILTDNEIADLAPLLTTVEADAAGPRRFAPYLRLYLDGNPLSAAARSDQIPALEAAGVTVQSEAKTGPGGE